ncbi:hypothetical protein [Microbacterium sp. CIAB417]|uniref:hypothetical protein n=1 Tax=Microbacterium sp. CIAB417 TaxID=2860287 RepID=UPI001FAE3665|nr:hypothetical protein [Microbacterium sp. CIAB417]
MAGRKSAQRTEQERARLYAARTAWHEGRIARRVRDNTVIGIVGGLIVAGAVASQFVHAAVTAPEPTPTPTPTETVPPLEPLLPSTTPVPSDTPAE